MTNWVTISALAAAASTLVLAVATLASVRSASRSARTADRAAGRAANPAKARGAAPVGTPQPVAKRGLSRAAHVGDHDSVWRPTALGGSDDGQRTLL